MSEPRNPLESVRWRQLIDRHLLGTITLEESIELEQVLKLSREARADFRRRCNVDTALRHEASVQVTQTQATPRQKKNAWSPPIRWAAALALILGSGATYFGLYQRLSVPTAKETPTEFVATLVSEKGCEWDGSANAVGSRLTNTTLKLKHGVATLVFDSGARLVLEGGSTLRLKETNAADLLAGRVSVRCPASAFGFNITTPNTTLVDLGTEFGVSVSADGSTELHVFEGVVEISTPSTAAREHGQNTMEQVEAGHALLISSSVPSAQPIAMNRSAFPRDDSSEPKTKNSGVLLAMESFDYPEGPLGTGAGGLGWSTPWSGSNLGKGSGVPIGAGTIQAGAPGFPKPAGRALIQSGTREIKRSLLKPVDPSREQQIFISFFLKKTGHKDDAPGSSLVSLRSSNQIANFIGAGVNSDNKLVIAHEGKNSVSDVQILEGRSYFLVIRCDFHRDLPDEVSFSAFDAESGGLSGEPVLWAVRSSKMGSTSSFDLLSIRSTRWGEFECDEIRIGTSWNSVIGFGESKGNINEK